MTWITTETLSPPATVPREQEMVIVPLHEPWLGSAETRVTPAGSPSESITPVASEGPPFVTVRVYVSVCPTSTGCGLATRLRARSADGPLAVMATVASL